MKLEIKVVKSVGDNPLKLVEVIERQGRVIRFSSKRGVKGYAKQGRYAINYKGKKYISFILPTCYGNLQGLCIDISF